MVKVGARAQGPRRDPERRQRRRDGRDHRQLPDRLREPPARGHRGPDLCRRRRRRPEAARPAAIPISTPRSTRTRRTPAAPARSSTAAWGRWWTTARTRSRNPGAEGAPMVEKIIEFCARNRLLVLLGVGFALVGVDGRHQADEAGRDPGPLRSAGHRLHRVDGPQPHAGRGPGHLPDRLEADRHAARHRRARLLDVRDVVRLRRSSRRAPTSTGRAAACSST